jgi:aminoglycoside phosphotransferase (APT) family kinase protein
VSTTAPNLMPAAEVDVTPELVRGLLASQQPDLADLPLALLANGWDNVLYRLGEALIVRLPRRELAARLVEHEQRWLPELAPRLPLPIPAPVRGGVPGPGYPWSWSIVPFLPGEPAATRPPDSTRQAATTIGGFLKALHTPAPRDAPVNQFRGIPLADRAKRDVRNMELIGDRIDTRRAHEQWAQAAAAPVWDRSPVWLHGDLHPLNILVSASQAAGAGRAGVGRVSGVIDFGDLTSGDPATDLSVAWMLFSDPDDRAAFWAAYEPDDATRTRAKGWALAFSLIFLAHSADNPGMEAIGSRAYTALLGCPLRGSCYSRS